MGYNIYITRKDHWADESGEQITHEEWEEYVKSDAELTLEDYVKDEGFSVWRGYSRHEENVRIAWFSHLEGNIYTKNPDEEILEKSLSIAQAINGKVQGDDGEVYDAKGKPYSWEEAEVQNPPNNNTKKWWQFWK